MTQHIVYITLHISLDRHMYVQTYNYDTTYSIQYITHYTTHADIRTYKYTITYDTTYVTRFWKTYHLRIHT